MIYIHVLKCLILIYVLYKSENIVILVTIWYIVEFIVSMYYGIVCGPKWPYYSCDWIY